MCRRACAECRGADVERSCRYVVQVQRRCRDAEVLVQRDNNKKLVQGAPGEEDTEVLMQGGVSIMMCRGQGEGF